MKRILIVLVGIFIFVEVVFSYPISAFLNYFPCVGQTYEKIQLKDRFPGLQDKENFTQWRTDYYICTGIAFAKAQGKTVEEFARFVGTHHSWKGIAGKGIEPAVQMLYGLIKLYEKGTFEIISENDSLVTMKSNRPYKEYFNDGPIFGVTIAEFESCLWGHIKILADRIGLIFKYKIDNDQIFLSIEKSKQ